MPADPSSRQPRPSDEKWPSDGPAKGFLPSDPHESLLALEEVAESYVLGRMTPLEVDRYEEHLLICPACREAVEAVDEFIRLFLQATGQEPHTT